eukprot:TRINITY_DN19251_c0_g1_i2.p4 TRINITY_DN19251_c0_g1~~TRINITY_DN19251_c0_g1_i2.p4  ORF type:complete len:115 (+),score=23.57 TRINITY_DN19251_c0_g1_i2:61-405(+)
MSYYMTRVICLVHRFFFFNDTATTEIYTLHIVGSVRCVQETGINAEYMGGRQGIRAGFDYINLANAGLGVITIPGSMCRGRKFYDGAELSRLVITVVLFQLFYFLAKQSSETVA